jgi:ribonuclease BN (tRNA processing enzyme)
MKWKSQATWLVRVLAFTCSVALATPASVEASEARPMVWVTLGTEGGPVIKPDMSQPSNLLIFGKNHWLIDCGDGASERLAAAGFQPPDIDTVIISHLHLDHTGGLQGFIGIRWMQNARTPLTIYGPPGTDDLVKGILQSMGPSEKVGFGIPGLIGKPAAENIKVIIIKDGSEFKKDGVDVKAVRNSHFDAGPGQPQVISTESLSFRFELGAYIIGFTADTGVSEAVTNLLSGSDTIISEVVDLPDVLEAIAGPHSSEPLELQPKLAAHLKEHHLTPQQAGAMADAAGAKRLVFTHISVAKPVDDVATKLVSEAKTKFHGEVVVAHDLDRF